MNGISSGRKLLLVLVFATIFVSPAVAEWDITVSDHTNNDGSSIYFSEGQNSIVFVELRDGGGDPILPSDLSDSSVVNYTYNKTDGVDQSLSHFNGAFWYAEFETDQTKHGFSEERAEILFEAAGDRVVDDGRDSGGLQNVTGVVEVGYYTVELENEPPSTVVPGNTLNMSVNVSMRGSSENINDSNVYVYFKNNSGTQFRVDFTYNETTKLYENESVTVPDNYDSRYMMGFVAKDRSKDFVNPHGSTSRLIETAPDLTGKVQQMTNIEGCDTDMGDDSSYAAECEPGATLETSYNVTEAEADNVTVSAFRENSSSDEQERYFETTMEQGQEGLYSSEIDIPDINTSAYDNEVTLNFNVTRGDRNHVDVKKISYSALEALHTGTRTAVQDQAYDISIQTVKPNSLTPWSESRIETLEVNVTDADGDRFGNYNLSNLTFDEQSMAFENEIMIPEQAATGRWNMDIEASDIYGDVRSTASGFSVSSSEQTFNINDTTFVKEQEGVEDFNLTAQNLVGGDVTLDTNVSESLDDQINVSDQVVISDDRENITVTVNLTAFESVNGHVNFTDTDTGYNQSVGLSIDARTCQFSAGDVCSLSEKWVNVTADSRGNYTEEVLVQNNASDGNATNLTTEVTGNISDLVEVEDLYTVEDELPVQINYSVDEAGNYTGALEFEPDNSSSALVYNTTLETTFEQDDEKGLVTASNIDLGVIPSGTNVTQELEIQNNGNIEIKNLEAVSSDFEVGLNVSDLNVSGGDTELTGLEFTEVSTEEGDVNISGNTSEGTVSSVINVNASTVENYSARTSELENRIEDLRPVRGSNLTRTLEEVSASIEDIEQNWTEGNYTVARNLFQEGDRRLEYVSNQDTTGGGSDDGGDDSDTGGSDDPDSETGGSDEGDTDTGGGDQSDPDGSQQSNDGGGLPIIPIVVVILVLGIAGFVFYESYIPEEGDPLYGVLGDGE